MKRENSILSKSKIFTVLVLLCLMGITVAKANGLLPSLSETVGIAMPSLGEAIERYPDNKVENEDGSIIEIYYNITDTEFNSFSAYLIEQEAELANYHIEGSVLTAEILAKGASLDLKYDNRKGEAIITYPTGTFDERLAKAKTHFETAEKFLQMGKVDDAVTELMAIPQYEIYIPYVDLTKSNEEIAKAMIIAAKAAREEKLIPYKTVGNIVKFGKYEQDNNPDNGPEEIEWIVLTVQDGKSLLFSKFGLDAIPYNTKNIDITWEKSSIRVWLNQEFYHSAFSLEEQNAIMMTEVDNSQSQGYSNWNTSGGNNTQDYLFLLSYAESCNFLTDTYLRVAPTTYALNNGAITSYKFSTEDGEAAGVWWYRSPGNKQNVSAIASPDGSLYGLEVNNDYTVARPAFWLNLESDIF